jgi:hypothetical protein
VRRRAACAVCLRDVTQAHCLVVVGARCGISSTSCVASHRQDTVLSRHVLIAAWSVVGFGVAHAQPAPAPAPAPPAPPTTAAPGPTTTPAPAPTTTAAPAPSTTAEDKELEAAIASDTAARQQQAAPAPSPTTTTATTASGPVVVQSRYLVHPRRRRRGVLHDRRQWRRRYTLNKADLLVAIGLELEIGWLPMLQTGARNQKILTIAATLAARGPLAVTRVLAALIGALAGVGGYLVAFFGEFPVSATETVMACLAVVVVLAMRELVRVVRR